MLFAHGPLTCMCATANTPYPTRYHNGARGRYVKGIQDKLGIDGGDCFKVQTGGPDGDLGSNEIKQGNESTTVVVDGSGVLCDPEGIDDQELRRLADARQMICQFDTGKLSAAGFRVLVDENDVSLPDGRTVVSGLAFRNGFTLDPSFTGDFFVPCGGRPATINESNVADFVHIVAPDGSTSLRFKYIVEGANLFL